MHQDQSPAIAKTVSNRLAFCIAPSLARRSCFSGSSTISPLDVNQRNCLWEIPRYRSQLIASE